jgi:glycosyltransferase involved in cell wall biosynthesis
MRVTLVTTSFPTLNNSTSGIFVYRLAKEIAKYTDLNVIIPAADYCGKPSDLEPFKVTQCTYAPKKWQVLAHYPGGIPACLKRNPLLYLLIPFLLSSMLFGCLKAAKTTDVWHANWSITGIIAGIAGKITGLPCITTLRGSDVNLAKQSLIHKSILYCCLRLSTRIVAVSTGIRSDIQSTFPALNKPIYVIPNGVDSLFFNINPKPHSPNTINIVCVGNLTKNKSVDTILHAASLLKTSIKFHLTIVGDGPSRSSLSDLVKTLQLEKCVTFTGAIPQEELINILSIMDIFVHASLSEGRPNVVLEAMASGMAVIVSEIDGVKDIVENEVNGLMFHTGDSVQLAELIRLLANDGTLIKRLGNNARDYLSKNKLTWEATALGYRQIYEELLQKT